MNHYPDLTGPGSHWSHSCAGLRLWGKAIDNLQTLKDLGADHYLAKPIGRHELLEVVGRLLAQ